MESDNTNGPRIVFSGTMWETAVLKSLLENAEIRVLFNNEIIGSNQGGIPVPFPGGNMNLVVADEDYEKALQVVQQYLATRNSETSQLT
jgi:hypothetical protein